mgnify:CR=1 FL=1
MVLAKFECGIGSPRAGRYRGAAMSVPQLAPLHEWTIEYVKRLPTTELEWLDFKQSPWLKPDEATFNKLSTYVSAFANYSGGYLVIGCKNPQPGMELEFDEGVDFSMKNGLQDWLEDKIPGLVDPPISGIGVQPIPFGVGGNFGLVVTLPTRQGTRSSTSGWGRRTKGSGHSM